MTTRDGAPSIAAPGVAAQPCGTSRDAAAMVMARERLVDELRVGGFDVSSLVDGQPVP